MSYPTALVLATFLTLVRKIGIHPGPGKPGPRIHDLRCTVERHLAGILAYTTTRLSNGLTEYPSGEPRGRVGQAAALSCPS